MNNKRMKSRFTVILSLLACLSALMPGHAAGEQRVGLVLSGGGAKGIAHAGVIQALEENDIPVDYVAGTSMGAIVGAFYACGYTPREMLELFTSSGFKSWSTGKVSTDRQYYINKPQPSPQMLRIQLNLKDSTTASADILPGALINPIPMNLAFMELFAPYSAECGNDFDRLMVPYRCVCSDVYHKHKIVCSSGNLGDAVRASMTFPMVFKPIEMDSVLVYDGGIYDNFPVDVMRDSFHPDFIIGVSVSSPDKKPQPGNMLEQLEDMIIQNNNYSVPAEEGIKIQVPVLNFGVLDFDKAHEIYEIGYQTGLAMADSIKSRISARGDLRQLAERRKQWRADTPSLRFDSVTVRGNIHQNQSRYINYCFKRPGKVIDGEQVGNAFYRLVSSGKIADIRPQAEYNDSTGMYRLLLDVSLKKKFSAGFGGWLTSSTNSFLYLDVGYHTLSYNSLDVNLGGWLGQSYVAGVLDTRFSLRTGVPSRLEMFVTTSRRKYYDSDVLFSHTKAPAFVTRYSTIAAFDYALGFTPRTKTEIGFGYEFERNLYYPPGTSNFADTKRSRADFNTFGARAAFSLNTLNNDMYPTEGEMYSATFWGKHENMHFRAGDASEVQKQSRYKAMLELAATKYFSFTRHFILGVAGNVTATFGNIGGAYSSELVHAPEFGPTPATHFYFNEAYRAYNFVAGGVMPIYKLIDNLQLRGDFYLYSPIRGMCPDAEGMAEYNGWFPRMDFIGELSAIYNFPFASLCVYGNYMSGNAGKWNFGVAFGLMFDAPGFFK